MTHCLGGAFERFLSNALNSVLWRSFKARGCLTMDGSSDDHLISLEGVASYSFQHLLPNANVSDAEHGPAPTEGVREAEEDLADFGGGEDIALDTTEGEGEESDALEAFESVFNKLPGPFEWQL